MSLLERLTDPDSSELTDQRVLPCQPALIILHYDADDLSKEDEEKWLDVNWWNCWGLCSVQIRIKHHLKVIYTHTPYLNRVIIKMCVP